MPRRGENITKRKDGRWEARVICGYDENRRAQYRYLYGHTYAEAKAKKEYAQAKIIRSEPHPPSHALTLSDLAEEFLLHKQATVKRSTLAHYRYLLETYIPLTVRQMRLLHISTVIVERLSVELLRHGGRAGGELSSKTVRDVLTLMRAMFGYAVVRGYIAADDLHFSLPRNTPKPISILEREEQRRLEHFVTERPDSGRLGVYLTLYTGLRIGELCALRWSDIDLDHAELYVRRTIQRVPCHGERRTEVVIAEPKTRTSVRTIPLPSFLVAYLAVQHRSISEEAAYLLTGTTRYIEPSDYYAKYERWIRKLGMPHYSFHALRHTFATRCMESGFDAKSLSEILGHADVHITLDRYVHPSMTLKRQQMERLGEVGASAGVGEIGHRLIR